MDAGSEAVDLMVREGLQITEASIKLLAAGSKNLAAFIYALAKDNKRVSGRTNMGRLLREGKELRVFQLRESDLAAFHAYAKKGVLYAVVKDKNARDGLVDLITNVDFAAQVNLFLERHGYADGVTSEQAKEIVKIASPILDSSLTDADVEEVLRKINEEKELNGYYYGELCLSLINGEFMLKAE